MKVNKQGLDFLKKWEGCVLTAYKDVGGTLTIGYGFTYLPDRPLVEGLTITQEECDEYFKKILQVYENGVIECLKVKVTQNQFNALVSFAYNLGVGCLKYSDLIRYINTNDFSNAMQEWAKYVHVGQTVVQGLVNRRREEMELFSSNKDNTTQNHVKNISSIAELAIEVMHGKYGDGEIRKQHLGKLWGAVQAIINFKYENISHIDMINVLADEVIKDNLGKGETRENLLGYLFQEVQDLVNIKMG